MVCGGGSGQTTLVLSVDGSTSTASEHGCNEKRLESAQQNYLSPWQQTTLILGLVLCFRG